MPIFTASSTCINSNPINLGTLVEDFEYTNQNCVSEYYIYSPTTTVPVSLSTPSTSSSTIASSSDFFVVPTFTGGEIILIYLAIIFLFFYLTSLVLKSLDRIKTKKTYIGYANADVEIRDDH